MRARTTVEDHGCTGKGRHATRTTTQRFSTPMPLLLLYRAPSFGCSSFFVHRGLCKNRSIDVCGRTHCLHVNLYGPQLLYSSRQVRQVFLMRTVPATLTVRVKKTCPNWREEYSNCGPYKFTCKHCVRPRTSIERSCTALCTQRTKRSQSLVRGTAIVEAWVY